MSAPARVRRVLSQWRQALAIRLRAAVGGLFTDEPAGSYGPGGSAAHWPPELEQLLAQAETQLTELREAWAAALARSHQADREWRAARRAVEWHDLAVDQALLAGRDAIAREAQRELNMWQGHVEALAEQRQAAAGLVEHLALAVRGLERQLVASRQRLDELAARDEAAAAHEQLLALREILAQLAGDGRLDGKDRAR